MAEQNQNHPPNLRCEHCLAKFLPNQEGFVTSLHGPKLTWDYVDLRGFSNPIKVEHVNGLGLKVPLGDYNHFLNRLDGNRRVSVIHVEANVIKKMKLKRFIKHVTNPQKNQTYCMQSLELTSTKMKEEVTPPAFARLIDLIERGWSISDDESESIGDESESASDESESASDESESASDESESASDESESASDESESTSDESEENSELNGLRPEVSRFLQINMAGSYINFHLEATGSGIWHHVLRGTEVLYLIKGPGGRIATKYDEWYLSPAATGTSSDSNSPMEDDDELEFHRVEVSEGETIFLPGGFFRAMMYPVEAIVVGGNYLNIFNLNTHLRIYEKETDYDNNENLFKSFVFPKFGEACWRFAYNICRDLIGVQTVSISQCIYDQLLNLYQNLNTAKGFVKVSRELEEVGTSNILADLGFIVDNAYPNRRNRRRRILHSGNYNPRSF